MITIDVEEFEEHMESYDGFCTSCKEWSFGGVESDAINYECLHCGVKAVVGAEMALIQMDVDVV